MYSFHFSGEDSQTSTSLNDSEELNGTATVYSDELDCLSFLSASSPGPSASQISVQGSCVTTASDASCDTADIFVCDSHNEIFYSTQDYDNHQASLHMNRTGRFQCSVCDKNYANKFGLDQHTNAIHLGCPYMCSVTGCNKFFKSLKGRNLHEQRHSGKFEYKCDICSKKWNTLSALRTHKISHSVAKKYPCRFCNKKFTRTHDRKRHENDVCRGKRENAIAHTIGVSKDGITETKSNRKGHRCSICRRTFLTKEKLTGHLQHAHSRNRDYGCTECMKSFSSRSLLAAHRKDAH